MAPTEGSRKAGGRGSAGRERGGGRGGGGRGSAPPLVHEPAPAIPDKLYFRIGEVARLCDVPAYVLRFWETEFPMLRPNKAGTGQRLFRQRDVEMAVRIKRLLYDEGYTIPGARQLLKGEARNRDGRGDGRGDGRHGEPGLLDAAARQAGMEAVRDELRAVLALLGGASAVVPAASGRRPPRSVGGRRVEVEAPPLFVAMEAAEGRERLAAESAGDDVPDVQE